MSTNTINNEELSADIEDAISLIASEADGGALQRIRLNFMSLAFREFVASDFFASTDKGNKKQLTEDYQSLSYLLERLDNLTAKYPENLYEVGIKAIIKNI